MTTTHPEEPSRRDFLYVATAALGAIGTAGLAWPFISQMNPDAAVRAAAGPVEVDLTPLQVGQQIVVRWQSRPVFIVRRGEAALAKLRDTGLLDRLRDPESERTQQPPYAANWSRSLKPGYLVVVGICTHLGCIPDYAPDGAAFNLGAAWPGGYFCPCHGSRYDLAGRVYKGVPAPLNLPVPPYHFVTDTKLRIGENPAGAKFDFNSIEQI